MYPKQYMITCNYICIYVYLDVCIYIMYTHADICSHKCTPQAPSKVLVDWTTSDPCAMGNKHLLYCVSCIVFEHKGQHIIADHFDSSANDCRPCQYSLFY